MCVSVLFPSRTWTVLWSLLAAISSTLAVWRNGSMSRRHVPSATHSSKAKHQPLPLPTKTPLQPIKAQMLQPRRRRKTAPLQLMRKMVREMVVTSCQLEKPPVLSTWRLHHHPPVPLLHPLWLDHPIVIPHCLPHPPLAHWMHPQPPLVLTPCPHRLWYRGGSLPSLLSVRRQSLTSSLPLQRNSVLRAASEPSWSNTQPTCMHIWTHNLKTPSANHCQKLISTNLLPSNSIQKEERSDVIPCPL